jgi:hypothetical protein
MKKMLRPILFATATCALFSACVQPPPPVQALPPGATPEEVVDYATARDHLATLLHRDRFIRFADEDQGRRRQRCRRDVAVRVIGDRGAKPFREKLLGRVVIHGVERRSAALGLAEDGDPRRIDEVELRQVVERRVGIKHLFGQSFAAPGGDVR